jgi:hypothetical protein
MSFSIVILGMGGENVTDFVNKLLHASLANLYNSYGYVHACMQNKSSYMKICKVEVSEISV